MSETDDRWRRRADALGPTPAEQLTDELLGEMAHEATAPGRVSMQIWRTREQRELGRRLLVGLNVNALLAMVYSSPAEDAADRGWLLRHAVESELRLRALLAERLMQALNDKTWIEEPPPLIRSEPPPPRRRVCDEAYVLLRELLHPEEDQVGFSVDRDAFLNMPPEARDQTIERAITSHTWNLKTPTADELGM